MQILKSNKAIKSLHAHKYVQLMLITKSSTQSVKGNIISQTQDEQRLKSQIKASLNKRKSCIAQF